MKTAKETLRNTFGYIGFNIKPILLFSIFYFIIMFYIPILLDKLMLLFFKLIHGGIYMGNGNAIDIVKNLLFDQIVGILLAEVLNPTTSSVGISLSG